MSNSDEQTWQQRIEYYFEQGNPGAAHRLAQEVATHEPGNAEAWSCRGRASALMQSFADAEYELAEACRLDPTDADNFRMLGSVYAEQKKFDGAMMQLERALAIEPSNVEAIAAKARLLCHFERFDQAVKLLEPLVASYPDDENLSDLLALAYHDAALSELTELEGKRIWTSEEHVAALLAAAGRIYKLKTKTPKANGLIEDLRQFAAQGRALQWDLSAPHLYFSLGLSAALIVCCCGYSVFERVGPAVFFALVTSASATTFLFVRLRRRPAWELAKRDISGGNYGHQLMRMALKVYKIFH